jgi:hypothetical protein
MAVIGQTPCVAPVPAWSDHPPDSEGERRNGRYTGSDPMWPHAPTASFRAASAARDHPAAGGAVPYCETSSSVIVFVA